MCSSDSILNDQKSSLLKVVNILPPESPPCAVSGHYSTSLDMTSSQRGIVKNRESNIIHAAITVYTEGSSEGGGGGSPQHHG